MILIHGPKHSKRNAELIREWMKSGHGATLLPEQRQAVIAEYRERGFLTTEDAKALCT